MLSISNPMKSADGAVAYYLDERKENYYLNGIDKQGQWFGGAAVRLGLGGPVDRQSFGNLLNGLAPDGAKALVQNAGKPGRQACWDMTFNAPKAASVLWAMSPPELRREIEGIHRQSVETALEKAEKVGGITRRGPGGKIHERAELLWATFQEGTSRAQDPHLHTHAVLLNFAQRADGTTGSLHSSNLFRWKMALGAIYQAEFAARLQNQLGVEIEPAKAGFGIRGVPEPLCREFSKRRQRIEEVMTERGVSGALEAKTAAKDSRPGKEELPPTLLFSRWQETGQSLGWGSEQAQELIRPGRQKAVTVEQLDEWIREAIAVVPAGRQHRSPIVREAARAALQHGADGSTLFESLTRTEFTDGGRVLWQPRDRDATQAEKGEHVRNDREQTAKFGQGREVGGDAPHSGHRPHDHGKYQDPGTGGGPSASEREEKAHEQRRRNTQERTAETGSAAGRQGTRGRSADDPRQQQRQSARKGERFAWTTDRISGLDPRRVRSPSERRDLVRKWLNVAFSAAIQTPMPQKGMVTSAKQARVNHRFARFFARRMATLRVRRQRLAGLARLAVRMACRQGVDPQTLHATIRKARYEVERLRTHLPQRKPIFRIEKQEVIRRHGPDEPCPVKLPVICVGDRDPTWWRVKWRMKILPNLELRVQQRVLFPKVARWNPLRGLMIPALRVTAPKTESESSNQEAKADRQAEKERRQEQNSSKSDRQSHTYSH